MDELESTAWLELVTVLELLPAALDAQLQQASNITHFDFTVLSLLRFAPHRVLQMKELAVMTNSTLPRLSHAVSRLEGRGLLERLPCPGDKRATNVHLTDGGRRQVIRATPGHIAHVRRLVIDQLDRDDIAALGRIAGKIARNLDPTDRMANALGASSATQPVTVSGTRA
jgi:DNA-binding MarR family transcriptional regulator